MTDISTQLRRAATIYADSYPPEVLGGGVGAPDPHIDSLVPATASAAAGPATVTVNGFNFEATSDVEINGATQATTFVSPTVVTVSYDPSTAGTVQFTVRNDSGKESNSVPFVIAAVTATDVSAWTVEEVKDFVCDHPDLVDVVADFERAGKNRSTLLIWLETFHEDFSQPGPAGDEV
jgi:hypothetical protein